MDANWIEVGRVDDIPLQGARTVRAPGPPIALFRTLEGEIFALVNVCPHRGGPLSEGIVFGRTVACPLHNWVIDLASGNAQLPDVGCTPIVPVKIVDGRIYLAMIALTGDAHGAAQTGQTRCGVP